MKRVIQPKHIAVGSIGERLAEKYLISMGFAVIERNHRKKWGEIDLIANINEVIHFVEVKTVSYETKDELDRNVSRGTSNPEQNVHYTKLKRLARAIETWVSEHKYSGEYQLDVVTVRIVPREKKAIVDYIPNVTLE